MFSKLRQNYRLSNILVRLLFVLGYVLYSWQDSFTAVELTADQLKEMGLTMTSSLALTTAFMTSALIGVALMFIVPWLASLFLNLSKFYNVPHAEYRLLVHVFVSLYYLVCGALKLINVFTPILLTWGAVLFPFLTSLGCIIWFYAVTSKLYFNDTTKPFYFRNMAIAYFVIAFVLIVYNVVVSTVGGAL